MRVYLSVSVILLIIISAGCVSLPGSSSGGAGLSVGSLTFSPQRINNNQLTKLSLDVENSGNFDIAGAHLYLFKLPLSTTDWTISDGELSQAFDLLSPAMRGGKSYAGEKRTFQWILRAPPSLPRDEVFSFDAGVRACYPYKTVVSGKMEVVSESEWLNKEPKQHSIDIVQSNGPIKIDMISTQPLIVSGAAAESNAKIKIRVTNSGDGTVTNNDCSRFDASGSSANLETEVQLLNKITIGTSDCDFGGQDIYLQKGQFKELVITCSLPPGDAPIMTDNFLIEMNYNYYVDRQATVNVIGTEEETYAGGGAPISAITLKDPCSKLCAGTGKRPLGICAAEDLSVVKYPGTSVDVWIEPVTSTSIPSLGTGTATIRTLNLHDVKAGDLGLQSMKLGDLDKRTLSVQYEKNTKLKTNPIGIVKNLCSGISDGMKISNYYSKDGDCENQLNNVIPLGDFDRINGESGSNFKDKPVAGLRITSILGRTISEVTGGNLTEIIIEDFKLSSLSFPDYGFLKYAGCDSKNVISPYTDKVYCQCIKDVGIGYIKFDGTTSAECTKACTTIVDGVKYATGGACDDLAHRGTSECSGTKVYDYKGGTMTITPDTCAPKSCICYNTRTISPTEAALICQ